VLNIPKKGYQAIRAWMKCLLLLAKSNLVDSERNSSLQVSWNTNPHGCNLSNFQDMLSYCIPKLLMENLPQASKIQAETSSKLQELNTF